MGQNKLHLTFKIYANKGCVAEKKYAGGREDLHKERFAEGREGG